MMKAADPVVLLFIDEIDCLATATQAVLYQILDWLGLPNAKLVLCAISNTMDLPERMLPRVTSRFEIERVDFEAYSRSQIYDILCNRLKGYGALDAFNDMVLRLCAATVSSASGDIRKALQLCRRAVEIRLHSVEETGHVTLANFESARKDMVHGSPLCQAVRALAANVRLFLSSLVIELRRALGETVPLRKIVSRLLKLRRMKTDETHDPFSIDELEMASSAEQIAVKLERIALIRTQVRTEAFAGDAMVLLNDTLDIEDLCSTLLELEDEPVIKEMLEGGRPEAASARQLKVGEESVPVD